MTNDDPTIPDSKVIARAEGVVLLREARRRGWVVTGVPWESQRSPENELEANA